MLDLMQLSQLVDPVRCRATAASELGSIGFVDRSARFVLGRLGMESLLEDGSTISRYRDFSRVSRWQWIDKQVTSFLENYPNGQGIEVDGGLSTRFHRISELLSWPRFSWKTINTHDVVDCIQYVFPQLDNCSNAACGSPASEWTKNVCWQEKLTRIVIIGEQRPTTKWEAFVTTCEDIEKKMRADSPELHILLSHSIENFQVRLKQSNLNVQIYSQMPAVVYKRSKLLNIFNQALKVNKKNQIQCHHLIVSPPKE